MITRSVSNNKYITSLLFKNQFTLLDHKYVEKTKKKMFADRKQTLWLKTKFVLKQAKYTLVQGFKDLWTDSKWIINLYRKKAKAQFTAYQNHLSWRITSDILKFVPYSVLIIIPFAQLLIPVLVWIFPNAVPSFFLFDTALDKKIEMLQIQQQQSHKILVEKLLDVLRQDLKRQDQFTNYNFFKKDFFEVIDQLNDRLHFNNFNSDELIHVLKFLGGDYITGTATVNKIINLFTMNIPRVMYKLYRLIYYKITKKQVPVYQDPWWVKGNFKIFQFNYFPFQFFKRRLLLWQIRSKFKHLNHQDLALQKFGMNDIIGHDILAFARQRGFPAISCYQTLKNLVKNDWVKVTTHPKFIDNTKLWYSVMLYRFVSQTNKDLN